MHLKVVARSFFVDRCIAFCLRKIEYHWLVKQFKPLYVLYRVAGRFNGIEDNEGLPLRFQVAPRNKVDDVSILRKHLCQSFLELVGFDAFVKISHLKGLEDIKSLERITHIDPAFISSDGGISFQAQRTWNWEDLKTLTVLPQPSPVGRLSFVGSTGDLCGLSKGNLWVVLDPQLVLELKPS